METDLLLKFLKCETSPEEETLLVDWLDAAPEHRKELNTMQMIMEGMALNAPVLKSKSEKTRQRRTSFFFRFARMAVAASVLLVVAAGLTVYFFSEKMNGLSHLKTMVHVPNGQRINITLNDGTEVWLNAGTQLEYPSVFLGKERRVKVSGEALFDVAYNSKHPFVVETFACNINVHGTKFNVRAEEQANLFSATLMSGSIELVDPLNPQTPLVMKPYDEVNLVNGHLHLHQVGNFDELLWTDGIVLINNIGFEELMEKFERMFDVKIEIKRRHLPVIEYSRGKIRVSDGIDHALHILQKASDFSYMKDAETGRITIL